MFGIIAVSCSLFFFSFPKFCKQLTKRHVLFVFRCLEIITIQKQMSKSRTKNFFLTHEMFHFFSSILSFYFLSSFPFPTSPPPEGHCFSLPFHCTFSLKFLSNFSHYLLTLLSLPHPCDIHLNRFSQLKLQ